MTANKIIDTFNEIDRELIYVKNKLNSLNELLGSSKSDASSELQKLQEENKNLQRETLEIMKQIAVHDLLHGHPPLALKVFLQVSFSNSGVRVAVFLASFHKMY